jgi:hypothetical protein
MNIAEYIKSKKKFDHTQFMPIYLAIVELIKDGYIKADAFGRDNKDV